MGSAIARGWAATAPGDHVTCRPLGTSGPDLVEAIRAGRPGLRGKQDAGHEGQALAVVDGVAWIGGGPGAEADTSRSLGRLIATALAEGADRVVVGLPEGGPPWDGGAGLLAALGAGAFDAAGRSVPLHPPPVGTQEPWTIAELDLGPALRRLSGTELILATDADFPLLGPRGVVERTHDEHDHPAGPPHADPAHHDPAHPDPAHHDPGAALPDALPPAGLDPYLRRWAELLGRLPDGRHPAVIIGSGAGGGVGVALLRLGARRAPGAATMLAALDVDRILTDVDLVVLAEPVLDHTFAPRAGGIVARMALAQALPVVVLAGEAHLSRREWIRSGVSACFVVPATPEGTVGSEALTALAARASRTWSPPHDGASRHRAG